jgi:hypothetical protein
MYNTIISLLDNYNVEYTLTSETASSESPATTKATQRSVRVRSSRRCPHGPRHKPQERRAMQPRGPGGSCSDASERRPLVGRPPGNSRTNRIAPHGASVGNVLGRGQGLYRLGTEERYLRACALWRTLKTNIFQHLINRALKNRKKNASNGRFFFEIFENWP